MRDVAVAGDLVRGVDHDDALPQIVGEHARDLAQHRGLADTGTPEEQHAAAGLDDVAQDLDGAVHGASDAEREADDLAGAVA